MIVHLGWLDHDPEERDRMNRVLSLFQESESRDELGLAPIRDSISDALFPGTSVLQTRLRYYLFVPWIYRRLEDERVASVDVARRARKLEVDLIQPLLATDATGVIGRLARGALKQLPSSAYWSGLASWGIRRFSRSQDEYHRSFDRFQARGSLRRRDDGDRDGEAQPAWDPALPPAPTGFPEAATFDLTLDEARYLADRIVTSHPGSLLAWLVQDGPAIHVDAPWEHPRRAQFRADHRELLEHARRFSLITQGASIVYNVALARLRAEAELRDEHEQRLEQWATEIADLRVGDWSLERFWSLVQSPRHTIGLPTRSFVEAWTRLVVRGPHDLARSADAFDLVEHRERRLKGARSRYVNRRALDQWGGWSALSPATFRWTTAQRLLTDLHDGLGRR